MELAVKKTRLLIIEDNPDTRQIYKDVFEREGFNVLLAEDGEKGLSYAQATLPDVILLDLMLPKLSGIDLLKRLRSQKDTQRIPVMIFSALADPEDRKKAADLGITEYSMKALNPPKQVVSQIRALLSRLEQPQDPGTGHGFSVALNESSFDISKLKALAGLKDGLCCPECQAEVVLTLIPDPTRSPGHWFVGQLACSNCRRIF